MTHSSDVSPADEQRDREFDALYKEWQQTGESKLRDRLIFMHENLVAFLAHRFADHGEAQEDLRQQGMIGLIRALDEYDPDRSVRFASFAATAIIGEIRHYLRDKSRTVRVPRQVQRVNKHIADTIESLAKQFGRSPSYREIATALNMTAEEVIEYVEINRGRTPISLDAPENADNATERVQNLAEDSSFLTMEDVAALEDALNKLPKREYMALRLSYFEGYNQKQVGIALQLSQMHASRLIRKGLRRLRKYLEEPFD